MPTTHSRPGLRGRRGHPLLRREHARRRADHLDEGADERDAARTSRRSPSTGSPKRSRATRRSRRASTSSRARSRTRPSPRLTASSTRRSRTSLRSRGARLALSSRRRVFGFFVGESRTTSQVTPAASDDHAGDVDDEEPSSPRTFVHRRPRIAAMPQSLRDRARRRRRRRAAGRRRVRRRGLRHARRTSRAPSAASTCRTWRRSGSATSSSSRLPAAAGRARGRRAAARALEGQGHDDRPLGADGHRHAAGVPDVPARLPARRDRPVHAPHRPRRARQQARVGDGDHPGARRGAPADRQVDRLHVRRLRLPDRGARGDDPARGALRGLPDRARDPHRQARGRPRDRAAVHRRAGELRAHAEPPRLLARAAAAELPDARPRRGHEGPRRREDRRHLRRQDIDESHPTKSNVEGIRRPSSCCRSSTRASCSRTSSRPTCSGATATTRSTSTAACRTSTAGCPTCSRRCGRATCSIITSDHGCDPTTPSTDHSREHALLLAYVAGRNAAGQIHEGRVRRRRRDRQRLARRQGAVARDPRASRSSSR